MRSNPCETSQSIAIFDTISSPGGAEDSDDGGTEEDPMPEAAFSTILEGSFVKLRIIHGQGRRAQSETYAVVAGHRRFQRLIILSLIKDAHRVVESERLVELSSRGEYRQLSDEGRCQRSKCEEFSAKVV